MFYDEKVLNCGLPLIGERIDHFHSVAVGIWVRSGSAFEDKATNGYSHFIEHMLFKGTKSFTAKELAKEMDAIGGQINAFTGKENTCYYAKVMDEHLDRALRLLCELVSVPSMLSEDVQRESGVILEEIAMVEDTPEDLVHELLAKAYYSDSALGMTILGEPDNITGATSDSLKDFMHKRYGPKNAVISVAGKYDLDKTVASLDGILGGWQSPTLQIPSNAAGPGKPMVFTREKEIEQLHLCVAFPGIAQGDTRNYALATLNSLLGGGMSSRLFQSIREESGMAYSVYSYPTSHAGSGVFSLYAGLNPQNASAVVELIAKEVKKILAEGVSEEEFAQAKEQLLCGYVLGQESTTSRMMAIGRAKLLRDEVLMQDEVLRRIKAVKLSDVNDLAVAMFTKPFAAAAVGPQVNIDFSPLAGGKMDG